MRVLHVGKKVLLAICFWIANLMSVLYADQFHYANLLRGDRAVGMGGAYTAVSDDASGVYYNPAGLGFALSNDISGSANALYSRKIVYKKTVGVSDFTENTNAMLPSFFGGLQKLDSIAKGLVFAFGVYTTDSELQDQNDLFQNVPGDALSPCVMRNAAGDPIDTAGNVVAVGQAGSYTRKQALLKRFHRTANQRGATSIAGGAFGWRINHAVSIGAGLNYVTVDELIQEYQDIQIKAETCANGNAPIDFVHEKTQNIRQHVVGYGIQAVLGVQVAFTRFVLGLAVKPGRYVSQNYEESGELRDTGLQTAAFASVHAKPGTAVLSQNVLVSQQELNIRNKKPLGSMPTEYRLGMAYFASARLLLTADATHYVAVSDAAVIEDLGASLYSKNAVTNYAAGLEYYLFPAIPIRSGIFTNHDARPQVQAGGSGQADHIDYLGGSLYLAWVQPNSQIGAGVIYQSGSGSAQKIGAPSVAIQDVEASSLTFAFSATHSF